MIIFVGFSVGLKSNRKNSRSLPLIKIEKKKKKKKKRNLKKKVTQVQKRQRGKEMAGEKNSIPPYFRPTKIHSFFRRIVHGLLRILNDIFKTIHNKN